MRVVGYGKKDGKETAITIDLIDYYDEETGFTAMERLARLALCHNDGLPGARTRPGGRHIDGSCRTGSRIYASCA